MRLQKIEESLLVEKVTELKGTTLTNASFTTPQVIENIHAGNWEKAYSLAGNVAVTTDTYAVYVQYAPTNKQLKKAKDLNGIFAGVDDSGTVKGYLQENENKVLQRGGIKNIGNLADELISIVGQNAPTQIIQEGYFNIVSDKNSATVYAKSDAESVLKRIKGFGSGVRDGSIEQLSAGDVSSITTEKDAVVRLFIDWVVCKGDTAIQNKVDSYRDSLKITLISLRLNQGHPFVMFLKQFLEKHDLDRRGYIVLNNLYANGVVKEQDFLNTSIFYPLLNSNLVEVSTTPQATEIVTIYKEAYYYYYRVNKHLADALLSAKYDGVTLSAALRGVSDDGTTTKEAKQAIANALVYKKDKIGQEVEKITDIQNQWAYIRAADESGVAIQGDKVAQTVVSLSPQEEAKYEAMLKGLGPRGEQELLAFLRKKGRLK